MRSTSKCCLLPRGRSWMRIIKKWGQMKKRRISLSPNWNLQTHALPTELEIFCQCGSDRDGLQCWWQCLASGSVLSLDVTTTVFQKAGLHFLLESLSDCSQHITIWKWVCFLVINLYGFCKVGLSRLVGAEEQLQLTSVLGRLPAYMKVRWGCQEKGK